MNIAIEQKIYLCPICHTKKYTHMSSLSRHKKICDKGKIKNVNVIKKTIEDLSMIIILEKDIEEKVPIVIKDNFRIEIDRLWITINQERDKRELESVKIKKYLNKIRKDHLFQETKMKQHIDTINKQLMLALNIISEFKNIKDDYDILKSVDIVRDNEVLNSVVTHSDVLVANNIKTLSQPIIMLDTNNDINPYLNVYNSYDYIDITEEDDIIEFQTCKKI
jgi:hypothetical protein